MLQGHGCEPSALHPRIRRRIIASGTYTRQRSAARGTQAVPTPALTTSGGTSSRKAIQRSRENRSVAACRSKGVTTYGRRDRDVGHQARRISCMKPRLFLPRRSSHNMATLHPSFVCQNEAAASPLAGQSGIRGDRIGLAGSPTTRGPRRSEIVGAAL